MGHRSNAIEEAAMPQPRDWSGMKEKTARLLKERTGKDVNAWNRRIRKEGLKDIDL
jgi:hypothetical protein